MLLLSQVQCKSGFTTARMFGCTLFDRIVSESDGTDGFLVPTVFSFHLSSLHRPQARHVV